METNGKRRNVSEGLYGTRRELPSGGWVRLVPRHANVAMIRKRTDLERARREALGLSIDEEEGRLPLADLLEISVLSLVGPVITGWGGFDLDDGSQIAAPPLSHRPDQPLAEDIEAAGLRLFLIPAVRSEVIDELDKLDAVYQKHVEVAEGNSPAGSVTA